MSNPVVFRRNATIGAPDAESDDEYLDHCFVDNGDISILKSLRDSRRIVLGRTGSGKTALLKRLQAQEEHCFEIAPERLSLSYITNSNVIRFFEAAGVKLDAFYSLLWKHVITVELLKHRYGITNEFRQNDFLNSLKTIFARDKSKERALEYLRKWGDRFWIETEYRVKEFTEKLESDLKGSLSIGGELIRLGAEGARSLTQEQRHEIVQRSSEVVSKIQVKELHEVIDLLATEIFFDTQQKWFLVIDRLDEDWADDDVRYKLIKALLESVRTFKRVPSVKIVVALRLDLYQKLTDFFKTSSFQEEKFQSLYLHLRWRRDQLRELVDSRVKHMFRRQYSTREAVGLADILPSNQLDKRTPLDYLLDRTFYRPREAILFLNECIERSEGKSTFSRGTIISAELSYSRKRLNSLSEEWRSGYPSLHSYFALLKGLTPPFEFGAISEKDLSEFVVRFWNEDLAKTDPIQKLTTSLLGGMCSKEEFLSELFSILYLVGVIGIKKDEISAWQWSYLDQPSISPRDFTASTRIDIHKTFWDAFGIDRKRHSGPRHQ